MPAHPAFPRGVPVNRALPLMALLAACSHWTWSWNPGEALVSLSGTDEVPPVRTDASGSGIFRRSGRTSG